MPYILKPIKGKFKLCLKSNPSICFSKKPITKEKAIKQRQAIAISEHKRAGKKEINIVKIPNNIYYKMVVKKIKELNLNPKLLKFSDDNKHKFIYDGVKFGALGYNDYLIYCYNAKIGNIDQSFADNKRKNYRARAKKVLLKHPNEITPAYLSYYVLW